MFRWLLGMQVSIDQFSHSNPTRYVQRLNILILRGLPVRVSTNRGANGGALRVVRGCLNVKGKVSRDINRNMSHSTLHIACLFPIVKHAQYCFRETVSCRNIICINYVHAQIV